MQLPTNDKDAVASDAGGLVVAVYALKRERDTWRAVAESYQQAFEDQSAHLSELQNICCATQMELENERTALRNSQKSSEVSQASVHDDGSHPAVDGTDDKLDDNMSFGTATIYDSAHGAVPWRPNLCFRRVEHFASQCDYGTALKEVDALLRGPLAPQARLDGLLLKCVILRKSEWLYDALAACSEALELCDRLDEELQANLPRIHFQRGICYYQLQLLKQARDACNEVCAREDVLHEDGVETRGTTQDDPLLDGRTGFETHRTVTEGLLYQLYDNRTESKRRRMSQQVRAKAKRLSLPQRWMHPTSSSMSCRTT